MVLTDTEVFWQIEKAHSEIGFKVGNLLISDIFGQFKDYTAKICTQGHDFTKSKIHFYLDPKSLETEDENLTNHLIGPDFFDTDCYNEIRFISYSLEKIKNSKHFQLTGILTIKGISKVIKLVIEFGGIHINKLGIRKAGFIVRGHIFRKDWGLIWDSLLETGGVLVGDKVDILCELEITQEKNEEID